jgi:ribosomal protein S27AE
VTATAQWTCPRCGASMIIGVHLTAARLATVRIWIDSS